MAIRCARWELLSFGYRLSNRGRRRTPWAEFHRNERSGHYNVDSRPQAIHWMRVSSIFPRIFKDVLIRRSPV
jgi:hypothetical protein